MSTVARVRPRRTIARVCAALLVLGVLGTACFLPFAGRFLVREDPIQPADAILVLAGARVERWLEAMELYRERVAPTIVLSPGPMRKAERELRAKGLRFPTEAELGRDALVQLGVPAEAIHILPENADNTAQEADAFQRLAAQTGWQRVIIVTSPYHTRRSRFAFRREFDGTSVRILVRASRHDECEPARWWRHRADIRFVTSELQKLALYTLGVGG